MFCRFEGGLYIGYMWEVLIKVSKFYMFNSIVYNMESYHLILTGVMVILVDVDDFCVSVKGIEHDQNSAC